MTSIVAHARATANTGATTQSVTVSSFGTVAAMVVAVSNGVTDGTEIAEAQMCLGFWTPSATHRCIAIVSEDNKATRTDTKTWRTADHAIVLVDNAGAVIRKATIAATTNGVTISWFNAAGTATAPPAAWKMEFLFIGGTDAVCAIVDVAGPPSTGSATTVISSLSFAPDGLIFLGPGTFPSSPSIEEGCQLMLGFATRAPTIKNACVTWQDPDNVLTTALNSLISNTASVIAGTNPTDTCSVSAFSSNGFTLQNDLQVVAGPATTCLAFKLPNLNLWTGTISSPTSTGNADHTNPGFRPQAALFGLGLSSTVNTGKTDQEAGAVGAGFAGDNHGSMSSGSAAVRSSDNINLSILTSDTASVSSAGPVRLLKGDGPVYLVADTPAWIDFGVRLNWPTVQGTARHLPVLFFGNEPLVLTPSALAITLATPSVTRQLILTPSAAAVSLAIPSSVRALLLSPSAAAVTLAVPSSTRQLLLTPDALAASLAIANATRALLLSPDPVATTLALPAATRALLLNPDALAASLVIPSATRALLLSPDALAIPLALPAAARALLLTADPLEVLFVVPSPIAPINLAPDPLELPLAISAATRALLLSPDPVATTLVAPSATRALLLDPTPLATTLALGDPTRALLLTPDPLEALLAVPAATRALLLSPDPLATTLALPAAARALLLTPDPLASSLTIGDPTRQLILTPDPLVVTLVAPSPVGPTNLTPDPLTVSLAAPAIARAVTLTPDPLAITTAAPAAARALVLTPDPIGTTLAAPAIVRALLLAPDPLALALAEPATSTAGTAKLVDPTAITLTLPSIAVAGIARLLQPEPLAISLSIPATAGGQARLNGLRLRSRAAVLTSRTSRAATMTRASSRAAVLTSRSSRAATLVHGRSRAAVVTTNASRVVP